MATPKHPEDGVELNHITVIRNRRLSPEELAVGREYMLSGDPRWLAAARLGTHPLQLPALGRRSSARRKPRGGNLSARHARNDTRQINLLDLIEAAKPISDR